MASKTDSKKLVGFVVALVCLFAGWVMTKCGGDDAQTQEEARVESVDSVPLLITQVQKCSRVYTAEYRIHKIVTHDDEVKLRGSIFSQDFEIPLPLGDRKIAIPMDATLKAYVDFSEFSENNVVRNGDRITIYLPNPKAVMTSSKIDQANIKSYVGLVRPHFSDEEITHYEQQGRASIIQNITNMGIFDTARENAASLLIPMVEQMGYKKENITVTFRKNFGEGDIKGLLDAKTLRRERGKIIIENGIEEE